MLSSACNLSASMLLLLALLCCCLAPMSSASSLEQSLRPLYSATEAFLDAIQPPEKSVLLKDIVPILITGNTSDLLRDNWNSLTRQWMNSYLGYSILICIGAFLIIFVPLAGCCVCCCRCCCNKCGGRLNYMESKGSSCRRGLYGLLLLMFATAMLFGCVFALLANQQLRDQLSAGRVFNEFADSADATAGLLDSAADRGRNATPQAVENATKALRPRANATLTRLQARLAGDVNGTGIDASGAFAAVRDAIEQLRLARNSTERYISAVGTYATGLAALNASYDQVRTNLTQPQFACPTGASLDDCRLVNETVHRVAGVDQTAESAGRQSLEDLLARLRGVNDTAALLKLMEAEAALANVSTAGMEMFDKYIAESLSQLNGSQLLAQWDSIDSSLSQLANSIRGYSNLSEIQLPNPLTRQNENLWEFTANFDMFRYGLYIGMAAFGLLLVLLLYMGLVYGCAGEPPYEDSGCCNRGVGANFLLAAVALGCLLYAALMLLTALFFLTGGLADTEVCRYLSGRTGQYGYSLLDNAARQAVSNNRGGAGVLGNLSLGDVVQKPVSTLLNGCNGQSLASAFNMSAVAGAVGLPGLIDQFVNRTVADLASRGSEFLSGASFNISQLEELQSMAANASALNVTEFEAELNKPLLGGALGTFLAALSNISRDCNATDPTESTRFNQLYQDLASAASLVTDSVSVLLVRLPQLRQQFANLNSSGATLPDRLASLGAELSSETRLQALIYQSALDGGLGSSAQLLDSIILPALDSLLSYSIDCAALGASIRRAIEAPCVSLLRPYNGFWSGFGLCLICLLPCFVLAIKLANLYRKTQKYLPDMQDGNPKPV
ncbi:hypothetical protein BOX15_Mlig011623g1 [Macrostomum lignano]|uniref:Prominin n=2 Tax=Macrostomum lignano TaxID=282301 RepID=A0A267GLG8_9PLAT|nr:hypothetical protein BOX15_Mlig011623g1 [Macrostomum lignano]